MAILDTHPTHMIYQYQHSANLEALRANQQFVLDNQRKQDVVLHAIFSSVEVTVRRAAREQRQGYSMLFDEMCAMPVPAAPFPQAETSAGSFQARAGPSTDRWHAGEGQEAGSRIIEIHVCYRHPPPLGFRI